MATKEYNQEYYQKNKDKYLRDTPEKKKSHSEASVKYVQRNLDKRKEYEYEYWKDKWELNLFEQSRRRAKYNDMEHTIEISDIQIPKYCPYLGIELTKIRGKGMLDSNASIDRIDNNKGYVKGNIQIISCLANSVKRNLTKEQLVTFATNILKVHNDNL